MSEAGLFTADTTARTVKGLLLPWNSPSRLNASNNEPIAFERSAVAIPSDVSIVTANRAHDRFNPVGRATHIEDTEAGLYAEFSIATTPEGDQLLEDIQAGTLRKLSAEITGIVRDSADHAKGIAGRLTGAAFVTEGAFAEAALFAVLDEPDEVAALIARVEALRIEVADALTGLTQTTESAPADEDNEPETPATEEEDAMADAIAPNTLAPAGEEKKLDANAVFELITAVKSGTESEQMLAALADIKISGSGALPANGVLQPSWLGEVWAGLNPERRYHGLVKSGTITALEEKGFKLSTGSELVQSWNGNKSELPTGTATTSLVTGDPLQKWAFAADIAREFYDIPAGQPVIEAFIREILRSYTRVTDKWALQKFYAAAGAAIEHDTYPVGYSVALGKLIQGIDTIDDSDVDPTFAIVAPDVYTELRRTPKDLLPEFVTFGFGRQDGTADGVTVIRDKAGVLAAGEVLVGGRDFAHINELGGAAPLQLDALDLARGGIDKAVVGYSQYMTEYEDGIVLLGNAPAGG